MDWTAVALSVRLAATVAAILLVIGLPIAYWLAFSRWRWKFLIEAVVALPLVLPPTVLGFYVLVAIGSRSPIGRWWIAMTGHGLAFTFEALVVASILYSLPFAVQLDPRSEPAWMDRAAIAGQLGKADLIFVSIGKAIELLAGQGEAAELEARFGSLARVAVQRLTTRALAPLTGAPSASTTRRSARSGSNHSVSRRASRKRWAASCGRCPRVWRRGAAARSRSRCGTAPIRKPIAE